MAQQYSAKWHDIAVQLDSAVADLLQTPWRVRTDDPAAFAKTAIGCLVRKAHTDFHAMLLLCENGLSDSAQILARCVLESCLNLLYIEQEPKGRGELFWANGIHQRARFGKRMQKTSELGDDKRVKMEGFQQFADSNKVQWPRTAEITKSLGESIDDKLRGLVYGILSSNAHGLAFTLEGSYISHAPHEIVIGRTISGVHSVLYLDITCMFFAGALTSALKIFDIEMPPNLSQLLGVLKAMAFPDGIPEN